MVHGDSALVAGSVIMSMALKPRISDNAMSWFIEGACSPDSILEMRALLMPVSSESLAWEILKDFLFDDTVVDKRGRDKVFILAFLINVTNNNNMC